MTTTQRIRCGNHRYDTAAHYHDSIAEVQACFQGRDAAPESSAASAPETTPAQPSRSFRSNEPSVWERAKAIPEGRYALPAEGDRVVFYEVEYGDAGTRWDGFVFINRLSSDNRLPLQPAQRAKAFEGILADIEAAALLYGQRSGVCGVCGITLTDDKPGGSIERGIGPVCAKKRGWG